MDRKDELLNILKQEPEYNEPKFDIFQNIDASNIEIMIIKNTSYKGLMAYYPDKNYKELGIDKSLKEIMDIIDTYVITYNDVIFLDKLDFEDFYFLTTYLKKTTGISSLVIDSRSRIETSSKSKKITDKIKSEIDEAINNGEKIYNLSAFNELLLDKNIAEIKEYNNDKIELKMVGVANEEKTE
jgi:hypothetical protein